MRGSITDHKYADRKNGDDAGYETPFLSPATRSTRSCWTWVD